MPELEQGLPELEQGLPELEEGLPELEEGLPELEQGLPELIAGDPELALWLPELIAVAEQRVEPVRDWSPPHRALYSARIAHRMNALTTAATPPVDELMPAELVERIAKYEASITRLEGIRADYVRRMPLYRRGFAIMIAAGVGCFVFGAFPGLWGTICSTFISASGYAMVRIRIYELTRDMNDLRLEIRNMHAGDGVAYRST